MIWLLTRPVVWPVKVAFGTGKVFGYRRFTVFLLGMAVGMLLAPMTGPELRGRVKAQMTVRPGRTHRSHLCAGPNGRYVVGSWHGGERRPIVGGVG